MIASLRRRWFRKMLRRERLIRALSRALWERTPATTPLHKIARWGGGWYVCEFDGRRWREIREPFDTGEEAEDWCVERCRERMGDDVFEDAMAALLS